jgi:hypothetical protein
MQSQVKNGSNVTFVQTVIFGTWAIEFYEYKLSTLLSGQVGDASDGVVSTSGSNLSRVRR